MLLSVLFFQEEKQLETDKLKALERQREIEREEIDKNEIHKQDHVEKQDLEQPKMINLRRLLGTGLNAKTKQTNKQTIILPE